MASPSTLEAPPTTPPPIGPGPASALKRATPLLAVGGALLVLTVLIWQGIVSHGAPDPTQANLSRGAVIVDTGILVFREGLEAILVLAALTASLVRSEGGHWRPIAIGSALSLLATIVTWFLVVALLSSISAPALDIQAATGLLAVVVLLVIMNWFFHKVYWTGWISMHNRRKRELTDSPDRTASAIYRGLLLLGFTSIYREGFEVVLFLQGLRLRAGTGVVLKGALIGVLLTALVALVVFVLHFRLPYRKMLVFTGGMLGVVLIVMVGESVQEMQLANWLPTTALGTVRFPEWLNTWFVIYPSVQSLVAQVLAAGAVLGSYVVARMVRTSRPRECDVVA
ncbi:MAG TPA: FTR1 family protein [Gemmatimonadales bacterium]|jgi:high-affinity iron transporter